MSKYLPPTSFNQEDIFVLSADRLQLLVKEALESPTGRSRICLHRSVNDLVQNSIIAVTSKCYFQPERHPVGMPECYQVIQGILEVYLWDEQANFLRVISLGEAGSSAPSIYQLSSPLWHTIMVPEGVAVFRETRPGPFDKQRDVEHAPWAPTPSSGQVESFRISLRNLKTQSIRTS